jgi:hypothetical protein
MGYEELGPDDRLPIGTVRPYEELVPTIEVGDKVTWRSLDGARKRHFGTVKETVNPHGFYQVRTRYGLVIPIHRSRLTKECG